MSTITKDYVDEAMKHIQSSVNAYDDGRVKVEFYAAGSRDTMFVYCENQNVAYISSKNWKSVWTKWVIEPEKMTTELGKALVSELSKDFSISWGSK